MALSGTIAGSTSNSAIGCKIIWSATQSISGNYSDVTATLYYSRSDSYKTYGSWSGSITIDDTTTKGSKYLTIYKSTETAMSATTRVYHSNDGSKSITISASGGISGTTLSSSKVSQNITLNTIPRASVLNSLSCSTSYFNGTLTYKYTPQSASFYNKLDIYVKVDSNTYTGVKSIKLGKKSASQQTGTVSLSSDELSIIYNKLPTSIKGTLQFTLRTYSDSGYTKQVGNMVSKDISLTIPTTIVPTLGTITLNPTNITTVDGVSRNILVQDKNEITFSVDDCKAGSGSGIKNYKFEVLSGSTIIATKTTTGASVKFGPFSKTGSLKFRLTVTDNRDRSASNKDKEPTWDCHAYDAPTFSSFTAYRCDSNGNEDNDGTCVKYSLSVNYSTVNSTNKSTVKIFYKKDTSNTWIDCKNALTDSTTKSAAAKVKNTSENDIIFELGSTYSVYAEVIDNYNGKVKSSTETIFSSARIFNIRKNKNGIAFGKMAEKDELFECKWPMKVDDKITFGNGIQGSLYTEQNSDSVNIVYLLTGQDTSSGAGAGVALHNTSLYVPSASNSGIVNLGSSGRKWNQLYAASGTISTSDRNVKTNIENMSDTQEKLFNELKPVTYKFIDGTSDRTHYGFISQDIEESLDTLGLDGSDFAGFCKDIQVDEHGIEVLDENGKNIYDYSLRYSEFIALNTHMIQKLQAEIAELKATIEELKSTTQN